MTTSKKQLGNQGEELAKKYLEKNKYKILAKNFRTRFGELDFVARHKKQLVFIEVKTKSNHNFGLPEEEFTWHKKQKMRRAIQSWLWANKIADDDWRVDLIALDYTDNPLPSATPSFARRAGQPILRHYQAVNFIY